MQPLKPVVIRVQQPAQPQQTSLSLPTPWLFVIVLAGVIAFLIFRGQQFSPGPGPDPQPVLNVVETVEAAQRQYAVNNAAVMDKIAEGVEAKQLSSWQAIQDYARKNSAEGRSRAFAPVDGIDTTASAQADGKIDGRESIVADYFRRKAEGHRRAAK